MPPQSKSCNFCICGLVEGHKEGCLSIKFERKERIGKYSGPSKSEHKYGDYK